MFRFFVFDSLVIFVVFVDRNGFFLYLFFFFRVIRGVDFFRFGFNRITVNLFLDKVRFFVVGGSILEWVFEFGRYFIVRRVFILERLKCEKLYFRVNEILSRYKKLYLYYGFLNWKLGLYLRVFIVRVCLGGEGFLFFWNGVC